MRRSKKRLYRLFIILSFVLGVVVGSFSIRKYQLVAGFKDAPESVGSVRANTGNFENGTVLVTVSFKTGSEGVVEPISLISTNLTVSSKSGGKVEIVDANGKRYEEVVPGETFSGSETWEVQVNNVELVGRKANLRFLADNVAAQGYSSDKDETLYIFWVKGATSKDDLSFEFNDESVMLSKNRPVTNIWEH